MSHINGTIGVEPPLPTMTSYTAATRAVHGDDYLQVTADVAPAMHVSTTFNYARNPADLKPVGDSEVLFPAKGTLYLTLTPADVQR